MTQIKTTMGKQPTVQITIANVHNTHEAKINLKPLSLGLDVRKKDETIWSQAWPLLSPPYTSCTSFPRESI